MIRFRAFAFSCGLILIGGCAPISEIVGVWPVPDLSDGASPECDAKLWDHVYRPGRLEILNPCIRVTGVITRGRARKAKDGDDKLFLRLDPQYRYLLNDWNTRKQQGDMVLEWICQADFAPNKKAAKKACEGFPKSKIQKIPEPGTRVAVVGSYVLDIGHGGWAEIHPVTSITVLPPD